MSHNIRAMPRYSNRLLAHLSVDGQRWMSATTIDLGPPGLRMAAFHAPKASSNIFLRVTLPWGEQVELAGEVVWVEPNQRAANERYEFGLRLTNADENWFHYCVLCADTEPEHSGGQSVQALRMF